MSSPNFTLALMYASPPTAKAVLGFTFPIPTLLFAAIVILFADPALNANMSTTSFADAPDVKITFAEFVAV